MKCGVMNYFMNGRRIVLVVRMVTVCIIVFLVILKVIIYAINIYLSLQYYYFYSHPILILFNFQSYHNNYLNYHYCSIHFIFSIRFLITFYFII